MIYLADTNVLLRFSRHDDPRYQIVQDIVHKLEAEAHQLRTTSQNFAEFWNVATRPANQNGFGHTIFETEQLLLGLEKFFRLLPDSPDVYPEWKRLVVKYDVSGVQVHDARLVAAMIAHNVKHILTFNVTDFQRYTDEGIEVVNPATV
ncbi:MAG: type II toxin-antitoxin system VapC family toxin [Candidatus Poribacteria bacterium]|nr:type II toxin-antitoxin system VapC family toxin [Candidatus Poribacteria bacterium]